MAKQSSFIKIADKIDDKFDAIKSRLKERFGSDKSIMIQTYRGFGNASSFSIMGRVLENKNLKEATEQDSIWENFLAMYKRFNSNEVAFASIIAEFDNKTTTVKADKEGYFMFNCQIANPLPADQHWHTVSFKLNQSDDQTETEKTTGKFIIPPTSSKLGIISDIDDTVLRTNSSNFLRMVRITLLNNAHTRLPFEGVAALYRALHKGTPESAYNPMFYVSSSPWNLYDLLEDFFELQHIPMGPFLLRDFGIDETKFIKSGHGDHKIVQIEKILQTYPDMKFILIGDSGEQDPEIFSKVVADYPERIECIYIRDVTDRRRDEAIQKLSKEVAQAGIEMLLVENSEVAAIHAAQKGYIDAAALPDIVKEKDKDENAPDEMEQIIEGKRGSET